MGEIRNDISLLMQKYTTQYIAFVKAKKELEDTQNRGRVLYRRCLPGYYLSLCAMLTIGACILAATIIATVSPDMATPVITNRMISLSSGRIESYTSATRTFCGVMLYSPMVPAVFITALTVLFISLNAMHGLEDKYRLCEKGPSEEWVQHYSAVRALLRKLDSKQYSLVEYSNDDQFFVPETGTKEVVINGHHHVYGTVRFASKEGIPFMKSLYGDGKPASEDTQAYSTYLENEEEITRWKNVKKDNVLVIPYIRIRLFPDFTGSALTYLIPRSYPAQILENILETICKLIAYNIILNKLKDGLQDGREPAITESIGRITTEDLAPYFTRTAPRKEQKELLEFLGPTEKFADTVLSDPNVLMTCKALLLGEAGSAGLATQPHTKRSNL